MKKYKINGVYLFLLISYIIPFLFLTAIPMFWIDPGSFSLLIYIPWAYSWVLLIATMVVFFDRTIMRKT